MVIDRGAASGAPCEGAVETRQADASESRYRWARDAPDANIARNRRGAHSAFHRMR